MTGVFLTISRHGVAVGGVEALAADRIQRTVVIEQGGYRPAWAMAKVMPCPSKMSTTSWNASITEHPSPQHEEANIPDHALRIIQNSRFQLELERLRVAFP